MKIYKRAFDTYPEEIQAALRAASVEHENDYELPAAEFLRITAKPKHGIQSHEGLAKIDFPPIMMNRIAGLLLFLIVPASLFAGTVDVTYRFSDHTASPQAVKRVVLTPLSWGLYNSSNISLTIPISKQTDATGSVTVSNLASGYSYRVQLYNAQFVQIGNTFTNSFGTNVSGAVYARDYLTISTNLQGGLTAYSKDQSDARFQPLSTNLTGWAMIPTNQLSGGGTTYTNDTGTVGVITGSGIGTNTAHLLAKANDTATNLTTTGQLDVWNTNANFTIQGNFRNGVDGERYRVGWYDAQMSLNTSLNMDANPQLAPLLTNRPAMIAVGMDVPHGVIVYGGGGGNYGTTNQYHWFEGFPQLGSGESTDAFSPNGSLEFDISSPGVVSFITRKEEGQIPRLRFEYRNLFTDALLSCFGAQAFTDSLRFGMLTGTNISTASYLGLNTNGTVEAHGTFFAGRNHSSTGFYNSLFGDGNTATGNNMTVEGSANVVTGDTSHTEGTGNTNSGYAAHVEGVGNTASGFGSHAAGHLAHADNDYSYVWAGGDVETHSTAGRQFTVHASGGIRLLGAPITGDAGNLTNGSPALATNNATATDGQVMVKRGGNLKLETITSSAVAATGGLTVTTNGALYTVNLPATLTNTVAAANVTAGNLTTTGTNTAGAFSLGGTTITSWPSGSTTSIPPTATNTTTGLPVFNVRPMIVLNGNGDSIIAEANSSSNKLNNCSFMSFICYLSGGQVMYHYDVGQSGAVAADMAGYAGQSASAGHGRGALADQSHMSKSTHNLIYVGANNVATGTALTTAYSNIFNLAFDLKMQNKGPILCQIAPNGANNTRAAYTMIWNDNIANIGRILQIPVVNYWLDMTQPGTNVMIEAYHRGDYIHPNGLGANAMGNITLKQLGIQPTADYPNPYFATDNLETNNVAITNGLFADTDANGVPDNWTFTATNGETLTLISNTAPRGNFAVITKTNAAGRATLTNAVVWTNFAAADEMVFAARFYTSNLVAGTDGGVKIACHFNTGDPANEGLDYAPVYWLTNDIPITGAFCVQGRVPASCTNANVSITISNCSGTVGIAQIKLVDITKVMPTYPRLSWYAPALTTNAFNINEVGGSVGIGVQADSTTVQPRMLKVSGSGQLVPTSYMRNTAANGYSGLWLLDAAAGNYQGGIDYANSTTAVSSNKFRIWTRGNSPINFYQTVDGLTSPLLLMSLETNGNLTVSGAVTATNGFVAIGTTNSAPFQFSTNAVLLSTITPGAFEYVATNRAFYLTSWLVRRSIPLVQNLVYSNATTSLPTVVTNTTTETAVYSVAMASGFVPRGGGKAWHIKLAGRNWSGNGDGFTLRFYLGKNVDATNLLYSLVSSTTGAKAGVPWKLDSMITATGGDGTNNTFVANGDILMNATPTQAAADAVSINTLTQTNTITVTIQNTTAAANATSLRQGWTTVVDQTQGQ